MTVAATILEQLGGNTFIAMTGATALVTMPAKQIWFAFALNMMTVTLLIFSA